jgi:hypothetical protein
MRVLFPVASVVASIALLGCFAVAETTPTPSASAESGIEGSITISPVHGGPVRQDVETSAPLAKTAFVVRQGDRPIAKFVTDERVRFRVSLPPGNYEVLAEDQRRKIGSYGPWPVEVVAGKTASVRWDCDSGMR